MKSLVAICTLFIWVSSCRQQDPINILDGAVIHNITIISADDNNISSFLGTVVIDGNHIIYAQKEKPRLSGNFLEIDGTGKFITAGLIDSHVHLANTSGFNGRLKNQYPDLVDAYFEQLPRSYLYHGFTTLIDVNNYAPEVLNQINTRPLHPDIYSCGNQVQIMDDFMMEMEGYSTAERYQFQFLYDKYNKELVFPDSIDLREHSVEKITARIKEKQGVGVKLAYEDEASGLIVSWAKPTVEILSDLVSEAKKQNLPVLLHAPSLEGHQVGLESGVEIFAHGLWNWTANFEEEFNNRELSAEHKDVLIRIAQEKLGYQLTFRAIVGEEDLILGSFKSDENLEHIFPEPYLDILRSNEGDWGRNKILGRGEFLKTTNPSFYNAIRGNFENDEQMWPAAYKTYVSRLNTVALFLAENKANFILGSDTPAMNMLSNPPGYNGFLEMKHMHNAGISLETVLRAATYNNAKAFHLEHLYGSVEMDKIANLLILKTNPLETIDAYNDIDRVIIGGKVVERAKLSATEL